MPGRRLALSAVAGLVAGTAAAFFLLPGAGSSAAAPSTTVAAATTTTPTWLKAGETRLGSTLVVPTGLQMEGDRILFTYDLVGLGPAAGLPPDEAAAAAPASFTLTYTGGTSTARVLGPGQRAGRFGQHAGHGARSLIEVCGILDAGGEAAVDPPVGLIDSISVLVDADYHYRTTAPV